MTINNGDIRDRRNLALSSTVWSSGTYEGYSKDFVIDEDINSHWVSLTNSSVPGSIYIGLTFSQLEVVVGFSLTLNLLTRASGIYRVYGTDAPPPHNTLTGSFWYHLVHF